MFDSAICFLLVHKLRDRWVTQFHPRVLEQTKRPCLQLQALQGFRGAAVFSARRAGSLLAATRRTHRFQEDAVPLIAHQMPEPPTSPPTVPPPKPPGPEIDPPDVKDPPSPATNPVPVREPPAMPPPVMN
jgi:hypothetical protein